MQSGSGVALGIGEEVQVEVGGGPLVAVGGVGVAVGGGEVAVGVGETVGVGVGEAVLVGVAVGDGVFDGVGVVVPVSVGVALSVGVGVSVGVSVAVGVGVTVLGSGEESCSRGAAVTVSRGSKVGIGVSDGGGTGLGGVGSIAAAICASTSELTGGRRTAVVEAKAAAAKVSPQITGTITRPTRNVDRQGWLRRTRRARPGRVISSILRPFKLSTPLSSAKHSRLVPQRRQSRTDNENVAHLSAVISIDCSC